MRRGAEWLESRARLTPDKEAVVEVSSGLRLTYRELNRRAERMASHLQLQGVRQYDRVALLAYNSVAYLELLFAVGKIGAVFVPLNYRFSVSELADVLEDSKPHVLIYDEFHDDLGLELSERFRFPVSIAPGGYESIVNDGPVDFTEIESAMEDPWAIFYTGGTTGRSKGVILSHRAILWNAINTVVSWRITEADVAPIYMPMFHTGGLNALTAPVLYAGGTVVIGREFDAAAVVRVLEQERCTIALFVPTMYHMIVETPEFARAEFVHMHTFLSGAAPCPLSIYEHFWAKGLHFKEGYGMTEAGPNNFYIHPEEAKLKIGSVGKPMFHNTIRLADEAGNEVPPGQTGEVWIQGPHVFTGYWNNPEATAEALVDGWLRTGDLGRRDEEGFHYIVGRKKDMIITGGENVYPLEVEHVLAAHPAISEAVVVGMSDPKWGEAVSAFLVLEAGSELSVDEIKLYCAGKLAGYKIPKRFYFLTELPKTSVGKIDKKALVGLYTQSA